MTRIQAIEITKDFAVAIGGVILIIITGTIQLVVGSISLVVAIFLAGILRIRDEICTTQ